MASILIVDQVTKIPTAWGQDVDNAVYNYLTSVAGTNTITATGPVGLAAYAAGLKFRFIPAATNTGATTINITGTGALGARNIFCGGSACVGGELRIGIPVDITDDGTQFNITGPYSGGKVPGNASFSGTLGITGAATLSSTLGVTGTSTLGVVNAGVITGSSTLAITGSAVWGTGVANFGTVAKRKTADESVTSSIILQDDNHLLFAIGANEEWVATIDIDVGAALNVTGLQTAITVPSGATLDVSMAVNTGGAANNYSQRSSTSGGSMNSVAGAFSSSADAQAHLMVWVLNGATPGNVTLQWAQGTSSGTALTFRKGSFLQATRVA